MTRECAWVAVVLSSSLTPFSSDVFTGSCDDDALAIAHFDALGYNYSFRGWWRELKSSAVVFEKTFDVFFWAVLAKDSIFFWGYGQNIIIVYLYSLQTFFVASSPL